MKRLHTTAFDDKLRTGLQHLFNYPQMMPFIGANWHDSTNKILLLGESHYMPGEELKDIPNETHLQDWYNNTSDHFYPALADYIDTRGVVEKADNVEEEGFAKPLTMFYNIKRELQSHIPGLKNEKCIFRHFSFYNYFQRPHFVEGDSIENDSKDDEIAYQTLKLMIQLIRPSKIIFASTKAKQSFDRKFYSETERHDFEGIMIDGVPHASSAWWNTSAVAYGNKTGREKFISLITNV